MRASAAGQPFMEKIPFTEWANLHSHLIWIYEGEVQPQWKHGVTTSAHMAAWLVLKGEVEVRIGDQAWKVSAGQWLFPPSGDLWRNFSDDARIISVRFRASWPTGEPLFREGLGVMFPSSECPELERAARALSRFVGARFPKVFSFLVDEPTTLAEHLRLQALFARWFDVAVSALTERGLVPSRMGRIDPRLLKAVSLVEQRGVAAPLAERELAREIGLSVSQFARLFARQFGASPHSYFERRRHEQAVATLQSSPYTVKEIAFQLGFSSLPHFSAWFRRHQGVSPREFRASRTREFGAAHPPRAK